MGKKFPEANTAHRLIKKLKRQGQIKYELCERCGDRKAVDAHHPNYKKPLEIILVCRPCHKKIHRRKKC